MKDKLFERNTYNKHNYLVLNLIACYLVLYKGLLKTVQRNLFLSKVQYISQSLDAQLNLYMYVCRYISVPQAI